MNQDYNKYTTEDQEVWRRLFTRQMDNLKAKSVDAFHKHVEDIGFRESAIPRFEDVNEVLTTATGWSITVVPGLIGVEDFFPLLADRKFPASTWLRSMEQLDYLEEPDMFHDVYGHLPFFMDQVYADFAKKLGDIGVQHIRSKDVLTMLQRIYWFTIEFGLMREHGKRRVYGAGILSSFGESNFALSEEPEVRPFDMEEVMRTPFRTDVIQKLYFKVEGFGQLFDELSLVEEKLLCIEN